MRIGLSALNLSTDAGFSNAGISRYCYGILDALSRSDPGHEFCVFLRPGVEPPDRWRACEWLRFPEPDSLARGNITAAELLGGSRQIRRHRLDLYWSTAHGLPLRRGVPAALTVHDLFPNTHPHFFPGRKASLIRRLNSWAIRRADLLIANSRHTAGEIQRVFGVSESKIVTVPLALGNLRDPVAPNSVSRSDLDRLGVPFEKFVFTIGTVEPRKNLSRLIEAFAQVAAEHPDLGLAIAGARGWKDSDVGRTAARLGLENRVAFLGYVADDDVPLLFAACELFVCASLMEGFGLPVLEALHFGAPVASSHGGALPEVAGSEAILFDPEDVGAIARALAQGLAADRSRAEATAAGREFARQFSWDRTVRESLAALERLAPQ